MHPTRVLRAAVRARDSPSAVVLHIVDPDSIASASLDLYLETLSVTTASGTKFLRSGGRATLLMDAELAGKVPLLRCGPWVPPSLWNSFWVGCGTNGE
jgi:hypothetical protein